MYACIMLTLLFVVCAVMTFLPLFIELFIED